MSNVFDFADTWNASGTTFNGIMQNFSNGSGGTPVYAAASRAMKFKKNGTETFSVDVDGCAYFGVNDAKSLFERPAANSANSRKWGMIVNRNPFTGGEGVGGENYTNEVTAIGWNLSGTVAVPDVAGAAMSWDGWEYKYNIAGKYYVERHYEMADTSGVRHRPWSFACPHDGGSGSSHSMEIDNISWYDFQTPDLKVQWSLSTGVANFGTAAANFQLRSNKNNSAFHAQRNAADNAFIDLPYYNASNVLLFGAQELHNVNGTVSTGSAGVTYSFSGATFGASSYYAAYSGPAVGNNDLGATLWQGSSNFSFFATLQNTTASGRAQYIAQCGATGRASLKVTNATTEWVAGMNNSGHYFLGSDEFASDDIYRVDKTNRNLTFIKPPKLPSSTVAALPSASTMGAGSRAYVTNATAPTFGATVAGGGAVGVVVYSDGTNWKVG